MQRVGANDAAGSGTQAQLWAGRNEYESFQIIVRAPQTTSLSNVNVIVSDLVGPNGQVISHSNLTLYREKYVYVSQSSPDWGGSNRPLGPGWYPDALIPFVDPNTGADLTGATLDAVPFSLAANTNQPIWADLLVPQTAAPGAYTGTFTVTSAQGSTTGQIALTVWNFTLPNQPSLKSSFQIYNNSLQAEEELLRNKLSPTKVNPTNERLLIDSFGLSSTHLGFWSGASYGNCVMSPAPSVSDVQTYLTYHQKDLYIYNYTADEIWNCTNLWDQLKQWARNIHQGGSRQLVTMAPISTLLDDGSGTGRSAVDIWVMLPSMYDNSASLVNQALQKGDSAWSYNAMVQDSYSPKWEIDFAPINYRVQPGFISESLKITGLLYWRIDLWSSDPWTDVNNVGMFHYWGSGENYPGEGMLVYPGQQVGINGVAPSMRLKWLRDGVEDYEYVEMLKKLGQGSWALQLASTVGSNWTNWTRDPNALESVRKQLGAELDLLSGGGAPPPAPADQPPVDVSVSPNASSGSGRTFTFTYSDANGSGDLASVEALFNVSSSGTNGCWVVFDPLTKVVSLANNSGSSWTYAALGSNNLTNNQCTVKTGTSSVSTSGNNLVLKLNLSFTKTFRGAKNIYMRCKDKAGAVAGYDLKGTYLVN